MADQAPEVNPIVDDLAIEPEEPITPVAADVPAPRNEETGRFVTKHPAYLRESAKDFFSDELIDSLSTDHLGAAVIQAQRRLHREQADLSRAFASEERRRPAETPAPPKEDDLLDLGEDENGKKYTEADVSGPLLRVLKKQAEELKKLRGTSTRVDELAQRDQSRRSNTARALLDDAFEELGEADQPLLGKGGISEIGGDSVEAKRRNAIVREAGIDIENDTPKQINKKIKAARDVLFPAAAVTKATEGDGYQIEGGAKPTNGKAKPRITPEEFQAAAVAKPTQRKASDLPLGTERAVRAIREKYEVPDTTEEDLKGVPD